MFKRASLLLSTIILGSSQNIYAVSNTVAPQANNDVGTVVVGLTPNVSGNVVANDLYGTLVTLNGSSVGSFGILTLQSSGTFTYSLLNNSSTLNLGPGEVVTETFTYQLSNNFGQSDNASIIIEIQGNPLVPIAVDDNVSVMVNSSPSVTGNVMNNDSNGVSVFLNSAQTSAFGALLFNLDGSFTYTLDEDSEAVTSLQTGQIATDSFTYTYSNDTGQSTTATINIQIIGNTATVEAENDFATIIFNNTAASVTGNVADNDENTTNNESVKLTSTPVSEKGTLTLNLDGAYTYTVNPESTTLISLGTGEIVTDVFQYTYIGLTGEGASAALTIDIVGNPKSLVALNDNVSVMVNNIPSASGNVMGNDRNGSQVFLNSAPVSEFGSLLFNVDGSFTYTLDDDAEAILALKTGETLTDTFTYTYSSDTGQSTTADIVVQIIGNSVTVDAEDDFATIILNTITSVNGNVTLNDDNISNNPNIKLVSSPVSDKGTLILNSDGTFNYTVNQESSVLVGLGTGQIITDVFSYTYLDASGDGATAAINIEIVGNPQGVAAFDDTIMVIPNDIIGVSGNVMDNDRNGLRVELNGSPVGDYGYVSLQDDGQFEYNLYENSPSVINLTTGQVVSDSFEYTLFGSEGQTVTANIRAQVIGNVVDSGGNTIFEQPEDIPFDNVDVEFNDRGAQATPLNSGRNIKGHLHDSGDKDWYKLTSAGNEIITLEVCPQGSNCFGKKSWVLYVFDSNLLTQEIEEREVAFSQWLSQTGSVFDESGAALMEPIFGFSNHMYLAYRSGLFQEALIGVVDPCFDTSNTVDIGVGSGSRDYFIAISSPLLGDGNSGTDDGCGAGSIMLERTRGSIFGSDAAGEPKTYTITEQFITVHPNSDDQYTITVTGTGLNPLLTEEAKSKSSTFDAKTGDLIIPKIRIFDGLFQTKLTLNNQLAKSADSGNIKFYLASLSEMSLEELADSFQATFNPENSQVMIPRVTDTNSGNAYSVIMQYHSGVEAEQAWLEVVHIELIQ